MFAKKSDNKKYNSIIEEATKLLDNKNFLDAVRKYQEAINLIRIKIDSREDRNNAISEVQSKVNSVHSTEIEGMKNQAKSFLDENNFEESYKKLDEAQEKTKDINDYVLKDVEISDIRQLRKVFEIQEQIFKGNELLNQKQFDEALGNYKKALEIGKTIYDTSPESEEILKLKDFVDAALIKKIDSLVEEGDQLRSNGSPDEAIKLLEKSMGIPEEIFNSNKKEEQILGIKTQINKVYSDKIIPLREKGEKQIQDQQYKDAIEVIEKAINLADKMYELEQKEVELKQLGQLVNPIISEQIQPIIENGKKVVEREDFAEKIPLINEAVKTFENAMNFINKMVDSEQKDAELRNIRKLINDANYAGIKIRKEKGLKLIIEKDFDKAISELYSALSLAKDMVDDPERKDPLTEEDYIKKIINQVYSAEIREKYLVKGEQSIEEKKYDDAIELYKDALQYTNKMYLGEEMDKEVSKIKNLIYQSELKKVVADGNISAEQMKFQEDLEKLKKKLDDASRIPDKMARENEMYEIRKSMDSVHSEEIDFLIAQGKNLTEENKYDDAEDVIDKALDVINLIEFKEAKNEELLKVVRATIKIGNKSLSQNNLSLSSNIFENALKITNKLEDEKSRDNELIKILNSHLTLGSACKDQEKWGDAFTNFEKAVKIGTMISNESLKDNEISNANDIYKQELINKAKMEIEKQDYDSAIESCKKVTEIDASYVDAYFNLANASKLKSEYDNAITYYQKTIELDPQNIWALNNLALTHELKGELDSAIFSLKKATTIDSNFSEGWYNLANVYKLRNETDSAIEAYQNAVNIDGNLAKAWFFMGFSFYEKKDYDKAFECLNKGIELDSGLDKEVSGTIKEFNDLRSKLKDKIVNIFNTSK